MRATYAELKAALIVIRQDENYRSEYAISRDIIALLAIYLTGARI